MTNFSYIAKEHIMKLIRVLSILGLALVLIVGGGLALFTQHSAAPSATGPMPDLRMAQEAAPAQPGSGGTAAMEQGNAAYGSDKPQADQQALQRIVIKTADLSLQVESARDAEAAVRAAVAQLGGYVVKVETSGTDANLSSRITFRVPAARFDEALSGVQGIAKKVLARTVSGDDVTEEFVDLEARLKNLEATRDRLQAFLDKATTVEDALKVNQSLSDIQGQIEQLKGRKQYLQQNAALSTISVYLTPVPVTPIVTEDGWQPVQVARGALRELISFGQGIANVAIVLLIWTPLWLPLVLLGMWGSRKLRGRSGKPGAPSAPEAA
jgi:uncharacterized protein DUF4349